MFARMEVWLPVFKVGEHTDSGGHTDEWTIDDLNRIVELYNNQPAEQYHQAPITKGHPENDEPSYGWVGELKRVGPVLYARFEDVDPQFLADVRAGKFRYRSIALYENLLLRHIAFLGAVPPAVKGLGPALMNEDFAGTTGVGVDEQTFDDGDAKTAEALARMTKFGIRINPERLRDKPPLYGQLSDEEFADPVHYRWPINRAFIRASLASFSRPDAQKVYSARERAIVVSRLVRAARAFGVELSPYAWAYSEPNNQQPNTNHTISHSQEYNDMTDEQMAAFLSWVAETFGEEVAAKISEYLTQQGAGGDGGDGGDAGADAGAEEESMLSDGDDAAAMLTLPDGTQISMQKFLRGLGVGSQHSEGQSRRSSGPAGVASVAAAFGNARITQLERRLADQAFQLRAREFNEFVDEMIRQGRLTPAERQRTLELMESTHELGRMSFSEGNKTPLDVLMESIAARPVVVEFEDYDPDFDTEDEVARTARREFSDVTTDPARMQEYVLLKDYASQYGCTIAQARRELSQQGLV